MFNKAVMSQQKLKLKLATPNCSRLSLDINLVLFKMSDYPSKRNPNTVVVNDIEYLRNGPTLQSKNNWTNNIYELLKYNNGVSKEIINLLHFIDLNYLKSLFFP